jgi:hypothetical protein
LIYNKKIAKKIDFSNQRHAMDLIPDTNIDHYLPNPGVNCPNIKHLKTGDLLFPRLGDFATAKYEPVDPAAMDDLISNTKLLKLIQNALIAAGFKSIADEWFGHTVNSNSFIQFYNDPLIKLFYNIFAEGDIRNNLFVGHVGMVICEKEGEIVKDAIGDNINVYVIESNITSYSHYRVAIHPYYVAEEVDVVKDYFERHFSNADLLPFCDYDLPASQAVGWVNRRIAKHECVWHASPKSEGFPNNWQIDLVLKAKSLHGRSYAFFDHPEFGDDNRLYCAEFIYKVYKDAIGSAADSLIDKMKWGKIVKYLNAENNVDMAALISEIIQTDNKYKIKESDDFFVLPPAILWNSAILNKNNCGMNKPYAPSF